jgi:hypothetical protein
VSSVSASYDVASTAELNHLQDSFNGNVVLVYEADLKRQVSR